MNVWRAFSIGILVKKTNKMRSFTRLVLLQRSMHIFCREVRIRTSANLFVVGQCK